MTTTHGSDPHRSARGTALVAGGSRGFGLLVAEELARHGYRVSVCARDADELERAREQLAQAGLHIQTEVCDVRDPEAVERWVAGVREPVEVAVHVAGIIQVGPFSAATTDVFDDCLDIMARGPIHLALATVPAMIRRGRGRFAVVSSIGGIISVPRMLPYSTAKFAATGFTEGLHAELSGTGVTATTVLPPPMRVGSFLHAQFSGNREQEYGWFASLSSLPLTSLRPHAAARRAVSGVLRGRPVVGLSPLTFLASRVHGVAPATTVRLLRLANHFLPQPGTDSPRAGRNVRRPGSVADRLTALGKRVARRTNEGYGSVGDP